MEQDNQFVYSEHKKTIIEKIREELTEVNESIGEYIRLKNTRASVNVLSDSLYGFLEKLTAVYQNSNDVIDDEDLKTKITKSFTEDIAKSVDTMNERFFEIKGYWDLYQKKLFEIGIKDVHMDPPSRFPWRYYLKFIGKSKTDINTIGGSSFRISILGSNNDGTGSLVSELYSKILSSYGFADSVSQKELFYDNLSWFVGYFDEILIRNCIAVEEEVEKMDIPKKHKEDFIFRVQLGEFSRLLTRKGYNPKPDIREELEADWIVPKNIDELSFNGSERNG